VIKPDYGLYMDIQQDINLRVLESLAQQHIEFASPSQRLWLEGGSRLLSELVPSGSAEAKATDAAEPAKV
jgi:small-conductance mechanosensitive channel